MLSNNFYNLLLKKFLKLYVNFKNLNNNNINFKLNKKKIDLYILNPKGLKCYLWLTKIENKNIICSIYYNNNNKKYDIKQYFLCCDDILFSGNGTLFNGVLFNHNKNNYYCCNDIIYYKNEFINKFNYNNKLYILKNIFDNYVKQLSYNTNFIIIGLPIMNNNMSVLNNISKTITYNVHSISYINLSSNILHYSNKLYNKKDIFAYFNVKPEISFDIYSLYCKNDIYYNKAFINDYKTSVMMNKLFRDIKENKNLDYLEESDDEEEFQNFNVDKYVFLERVYVMKCIYIKEFKSWKPVCVDKSICENSIDEINNILL
jgi:hypothetical protein